MRWWVFTDGRVSGPYRTETLARRPSFTAEALVCPESFAGGGADHWVRAGSMPTLRSVLEGRPFPPDPTLADVADARRLAERLAELESSTRHAMAEIKEMTLRERDMRAELYKKDRMLRDLDARLSQNLSQLGAVQALEEGLRAVLESLRGQRQEVGTLEARLAALTVEMGGALDRTDKAAADTARRAAEALDEARAAVAQSLETAARALAAAEESRGASEGPRKPGRGRPARPPRRAKPPLPPSDLGLPDATPIEPTGF